MTRDGELDVAANRGARKYAAQVHVARVLWGAAWRLFAFSPRPLWGWRRITMPWKLEIGELAAIGDHAILYALGSIHIGPRATVSQYAHLCVGTHDMVVAEALSAGIPVISTKGAPWVGLETVRCGLWVDHGPDAMAAAFDTALALPDVERAAMGVRGRAWMAREFGWDGIATRMSNVYEWLLGRGERPVCVERT